MNNKFPAFVAAGLAATTLASAAFAAVEAPITKVIPLQTSVTGHSPVTGLAGVTGVSPVVADAVSVSGTSSITGKTAISSDTSIIGFSPVIGTSKLSPVQKSIKAQSVSLSVPPYTRRPFLRPCLIEKAMTYDACTRPAEQALLPDAGDTVSTLNQ